jgi:beta-mannanase
MSADTIKKYRPKGYITIITVMTISAIAIALVISLIYSGISATKSSASLANLAESRAFASACAEEALQNIQENNNYSGNLNISFTNGSCSANTSKVSTEIFNISATATSSGAIKRISVTTSQTSPKIIISSWQEVTGF